MNSWIDVLVAISLVFILVRMVMRLKNRFWKWFVAVFGVVFLTAELIGAFSGNTLSDNLIRDVPIASMVGATIYICWLGVAHWLDLKRRGKNVQDE